MRQDSLHLPQAAVQTAHVADCGNRAFRVLGGQHLRYFVVACVLYLILAENAFADFGPKPINQVRIDVRLDGKPIGDEAIGVLLVPAKEGELEPANAARKAPDLEIPYVDGGGKEWSYGGYLWGGTFSDGAVDFRGFVLGAGGMPSRVRLAVILPDTGQQLVTNAARPSVHYAIFHAELSPNGSAKLRSVPTPLWGRLDFLKALLVTLLFESILVGMVASQGKMKATFTKVNEKIHLRRLMTVCAVVNLLSLPILWLATGHYVFTLGFTKGMLIFLGIEALVLVVEGTAYGLMTRLSWKTALRAALVANVTTCVLGFVF